MLLPAIFRNNAEMKFVSRRTGSLFCSLCNHWIVKHFSVLQETKVFWRPTFLSRWNFHLLEKNTFLICIKVKVKYRYMLFYVIIIFIKIKTAERHVRGVIICPVWQLLLSKYGLPALRSPQLCCLPLAPLLSPGVGATGQSAQLIVRVRAAAVILVKI